MYSLKHKDLGKFIWEGLDLERFTVIAILPQNAKNAVILMRSRYPENDPTPWCVQYAGSGCYFKTSDELFAYCTSRKWKMGLNVVKLP